MHELVQLGQLKRTEQQDADKDMKILQMKTVQKYMGRE